MPLSEISSGVWELEYDTDWICPFKREEFSGIGRGLIYFDHKDGECIFGTEQQDMVRIYDSMSTVSGYVVDYLRGNIHFSGDLSACLSDYYWNYVSVVDAWPDEIVPPLPVVAIELLESDDKPLQLGYGSIRTGFWNIQIFANDKGERDDLLDVIYDGIYQKRCPLYSLKNGLPIVQRDGVYNSDFSVEIEEHFSSHIFEKVKKRLSGLPSWGFYDSERINKYRAEITFETWAYRS